MYDRTIDVECVDGSVSLSWQFPLSGHVWSARSFTFANQRTSLANVVIAKRVNVGSVRKISDPNQMAVVTNAETVLWNESVANVQPWSNHPEQKGGSIICAKNVQKELDWPWPRSTMSLLRRPMLNYNAWCVIESRVKRTVPRMWRISEGWSVARDFVWDVSKWTTTSSVRVVITGIYVPGRFSRKSGLSIFAVTYISHPLRTRIRVILPEREVRKESVPRVPNIPRKGIRNKNR